MSGERVWVRHGGWDLLVNDAGITARKTTASVYCAGRSLAEEPLPFYVCFGVRSGPLDLSTDMSPAAARALAAALIDAADSADAHTAAATRLEAA
jgi:hypothetical protein